MSMVGTERTLIIACGEYGLNKYVECNDRIFIYALPESTLQAYDPREKGRIQYFIESRGCTQVVIVGSVEGCLIRRLIGNGSNLSSAALLKFNLKVFLRNQNAEILPNWLRDQILVEQHIISQCKVLMDYYFVRDRVENKQLQIKGFVIGQAEENLKPIFRNGIIHNDIISMN